MERGREDMGERRNILQASLFEIHKKFKLALFLHRSEGDHLASDPQLPARKENRIVDGSF